MELDLNLLRIFDVIYTEQNVSRAADLLDLTQPAVSQSLTRLRNALGDPLFVRTGGGVRPTARAQRMAPIIHEALQAIESAAFGSASFEPEVADRIFRFHMTDIGENQFMPRLLTSLREQAPNVRVETMCVPIPDLGRALDQGRIDLAVGFIPGLKAVHSKPMFKDRYIVLMRGNHPFAEKNQHGPVSLEDISELEFISVRTHKFTYTALKSLNLAHRIRLTTEHFMALPAIIETTDLAVIMPRDVAQSFMPTEHYAIIEVDFPSHSFNVSVHWSYRYNLDPANKWLRELVLELYSK